MRFNSYTNKYKKKKESKKDPLMERTIPESKTFDFKISYITKSGNTKEKYYTVCGFNEQDARKRAYHLFKREYTALISD